MYLHIKNVQKKQPMVSIYIHFLGVPQPRSQTNPPAGAPGRGSADPPWRDPGVWRWSGGAKAWDSKGFYHGKEMKKYVFPKREPHSKLFGENLKMIFSGKKKKKKKSVIARSLGERLTLSLSLSLFFPLKPCLGELPREATSRLNARGPCWFEGPSCWPWKMALGIGLFLWIKALLWRIHFFQIDSSEKKKYVLFLNSSPISASRKQKSDTRNCKPFNKMNSMFWCAITYWTIETVLFHYLLIISKNIFPPSFTITPRLNSHFLPPQTTPPPQQQPILQQPQYSKKSSFHLEPPCLGEVEVLPTAELCLQGTGGGPTATPKGGGEAPVSVLFDFLLVFGWAWDFLGCFFAVVCVFFLLVCWGWDFLMDFGPVFGGSVFCCGLCVCVVGYLFWGDHWKVRGAQALACVMFPKVVTEVPLFTHFASEFIPLHTIHPWAGQQSHPPRTTFKNQRFGRFFWCLLQRCFIGICCSPQSSNLRRPTWWWKHDISEKRNLKNQSTSAEHLLEAGEKLFHGRMTYSRSYRSSEPTVTCIACLLHLSSVCICAFSLYLCMCHCV